MGGRPLLSIAAVGDGPVGAGGEATANGAVGPGCRAVAVGPGGGESGGGGGGGGAACGTGGTACGTGGGGGGACGLGGMACGAGGAGVNGMPRSAGGPGSGVFSGFHRGTAGAGAGAARAERASAGGAGAGRSGPEGDRVVIRPLPDVRSPPGLGPRGDRLRGAPRLKRPVRPVRTSKARQGIGESYPGALAGGSIVRTPVPRARMRAAEVS